MRKIIWLMTSPKEKDITVKDLQRLANNVLGELIAFGEGGYAIIGDEGADRKLKNLQAKADLILKPQNTQP